MAEQFFCLRGPQTVNSDPWHREKQNCIYTHGACPSWTLQVKCAMWTSSTCWPCSAGSRSQFSKQETEHNTPHTWYQCTAYWIKLQKCFWKYRECYFLSKAVMYQERSQSDHISGTGKKDVRVNISNPFTCKHTPWNKPKMLIVFITLYYKQRLWSQRK